VRSRRSHYQHLVALRDFPREDNREGEQGMLRKLGDHIALCHARAEECEAYARDIIDDAVRDQYVEMARHWKRLAASYEYNLSLEEFLIDTHKKGWPFQTDKLPKPPDYDR
jgi:hypothetical protein